MLKSAVYNWNQIPAEPTPVGSRRPFFDSQTATLDRLAVHSTTLNPGQQAHEPHQHPEEEIMIVKDGTLTAMINGQFTKMETGSIIHIAPNDLHGWKNTGNVPATYYVFRIWTAATGQAK
ncbi:MAG TPA: cupin domain-containing protein [Tepidisphaeraceae bacterium]|nr:cupin domain-containing protein [Tepidisphaeraceae bacterium]